MNKLAEIVEAFRHTTRAMVSYVNFSGQSVIDNAQ